MMPVPGVKTVEFQSSSILLEASFYYTVSSNFSFCLTSVMSTGIIGSSISHFASPEMSLEFSAPKMANFTDENSVVNWIQHS